MHLLNSVLSCHTDFDVILTPLSPCSFAVHCVHMGRLCTGLQPYERSPIFRRMMLCHVPLALAMLALILLLAGSSRSIARQSTFAFPSRSVTPRMAYPQTRHAPQVDPCRSGACGRPVAVPQKIAHHEAQVHTGIHLEEPTTGGPGDHWEVARIDNLVEQVKNAEHKEAALPRHLREMSKKWPFHPKRSDDVDAVRAQAAGKLFALLEEHRDNLRAGQFTGIVHSLGHLYAKDSRFWTDLSGPQSPVISGLVKQGMRPHMVLRFSGQDVGLIIWGLAKMGAKYPDFVELLTNRLTAPTTLRSLNANTISVVCYSLARLRHRDRALMAALATQAMRTDVLHEFTSQGLSNTAWAFAHLRVRNGLLMHALAGRLAADEMLPRLKPQEISNTLWAFGTLHIRNDDLLWALAERVQLPEVLPALTPQGLSNIAWAFAQLGVRHEALLDRIARRATDQAVLARFRSQAIANMVWAYATLDHRQGVLLAALAMQATQEAPHFNAQEVANTIWGYARFGVYDEMLLEALAQRTVADGVIPRFTAAGVSQVMPLASRLLHLFRHNVIYTAPKSRRSAVTSAIDTVLSVIHNIYVVYICHTVLLHDNPAPPRPPSSSNILWSSSNSFFSTSYPKTRPRSHPDYSEATLPKPVRVSPNKPRKYRPQPVQKYRSPHKQFLKPFPPPRADTNTPISLHQRTKDNRPDVLQPPGKNKIGFPPPPPHVLPLPSSPPHPQGPGPPD